MIINQASLSGANTNFKTIFNGAFGAVKNAGDYLRLAMVVTSTTSQNTYPFLLDEFEIKEWLGDRQYQNAKSADFTIVNKDFEGTVTVSRNHIADDNLGIYSIRFQQMGAATAAFPNTKVFGLLKAGFTTKCYDGQNFIDTDHPGFDENGQEVSVSNHMGGTGTPWFLVATGMPIKPIIYQERQKFTFVAKDQPTDDRVFDRKEYVYGVDGRMNVGFGMPQLIVGSKQPLNPETYAQARAAFASWHKKSGAPLGVEGDLLVVPKTLEAEGRKTLISERKANGEDNEWKGSAELLVTSWL